MKKAILFCGFQALVIFALFAQQSGTTTVSGKYYSLTLPGIWQKTDAHIFLNNENTDIADKTLASITLSDKAPEEKTEGENEKKPGFFSGLWHGIRTPFVFVINLFKEDDFVIFAASRTVMYTIGYIMGIIFILSAIFGGSGGARR